MKDSQFLPILSLKNTVVFPHLFVPLSISRSFSLAAVEAALQDEEKTIGLFAQRDASVEEPKQGTDLYSVGTKGVIKKISRLNERIDVLVQGVTRITLLKVESSEPFIRGRVHIFPLPEDRGPEVEALQRSVLDLAARVLQLGQPKNTFDFSQLADLTKHPLQLTYMLASMLGLDLEKEQNILEASTIADALRTLYGHLAHEIEILELRQKIANHAQTEMSRQQREYVLRQQLRAIQEELGETSAEKSETQELRQKLKEAQLPELVRKEAERELNRMEHLPPIAPDAQVIRAYLDFLLDLPWNKSTVDVIDLNAAKTILDQDHFDLKEVKDRILEHLAVLKLNPKAKAPIFCFVGPPGVGKTSLGQSIARALGRTFERMSLGGLHDEAELRGHRRTYIGAMPGRILQAIRRAGVNNPLLMLDEVDKIGADFRGDPAAALLEILDPAQNNNFRDNYLDLPFDLSKILFITTANTLETVARPLLDRMEILRLSGYSAEEKLAIARRYLIPRRLEEAGLTEEQLQIPDETVSELISHYTHEAGVRELERTIGRLASRIARRFAEGNTTPIIVEKKDLNELLGPQRFRPEKVRQELPPGVAVGLAWTPVGGEILYVEASLIPQSDELRLTGQLGEVMRESAKAAQTYLWSRLDRWNIDSARFRKMGLHVHVPAGAIPKDGPSAGVAMTAAIASAILKVPCRFDTSMTGEITLSGLVLPVGGIKEKVLASRRANILRLIIPKENEKDLSEVPEEVRKDMAFILVDDIEGALEAALPYLLRRFPSSAAS